MRFGRLSSLGGSNSWPHQLGISSPLTLPLSCCLSRCRAQTFGGSFGWWQRGCRDRFQSAVRLSADDFWCIARRGIGISPETAQNTRVTHVAIAKVNIFRLARPSSFVLVLLASHGGHGSQTFEARFGKPRADNP